MTRRQVFPFFGAVFFEQDTRAAEHRLFDLINEERTDSGLPGLIWLDPLASTARNHSKRMMEAGFFKHVDPELGDLVARLSAAGILWSHCAENILRSRGWEHPERRAMVHWMYSPGHRANILLEAVTHSGIGIARRADDEWFITQQFIAFPLAPKVGRVGG